MLALIGRSSGRSLSAPLLAVSIFAAAFLATILLDHLLPDPEAPALSVSSTASEQNPEAQETAPEENNLHDQRHPEAGTSSGALQEERADRTPTRTVDAPGRLVEKKTALVVSTPWQTELKEDRHNQEKRTTRRPPPPPTYGEVLAERDGNESVQQPQRKGLLHLRLEADRDRKATFPVLEPTEKPRPLNEEIRVADLIVTVQPGYGTRGGEGHVSIHVRITRSPAPTALTLELLHDDGLGFLRIEPGPVSTKAQKLIHTYTESGKVRLEVSGGATGLGSGVLASLHFAIAEWTPQQTSLVVRPITVDHGAPARAASVHANMLVE